MPTSRTISILPISLILAVCLSLVPSGLTFAQAGDPLLYFSDLTSGPKTGNSDDSGGRTPGADGAIVTVWGVNLGSSQGQSKVTCNNADAASYYAWGNAVSPADLYTYHRMQMISFQVSHLASDGAGAITVTVNGRTSNPLPFTVRNGSIFFVKTSGDDNSGMGSWAQPWRTVQKAASSLATGDIAYVCDGVRDTTEGENDAAVSLDSDGTAERPKALVVYPGASARVGGELTRRAFWNFDSRNNLITDHWVLSKFRISAREVGIYSRNGFRIVGNLLTAPYGDGYDGMINVVGNGVSVLGNELHDVGIDTCVKFFHTIYTLGVRRDDPPRAPTESDREIAWNYIHDNKANRGVNIYSEQPNSAFIEKHRVHDNVIVNQRGDGIMLGYYVTGENWIYNNLLIRAGGGPEWLDDPTYHCGIRINTGHELVSGTTVYCFNNTLVGCGTSEAILPEESGHVLISPEALQSSAVHFRNNLVFSTGEPLVAGESAALPSGDYRNLWFGAGSAPSWDTGALTADPQFVNPAGNDFRLKNSSPCINAGTDVSAVVQRDLLGVLRTPGSTDIGAYEYTSTTGVHPEGRREMYRSGFSLEQNYPNPFTGETRIVMRLSQGSRILLRVLDMFGREVGRLAEGEYMEGLYTLRWSGSDEHGRMLPAGMYHCQLIAGGIVATRSMILVQ